jgi:Family of unknown function (DUF5372)
VTIRQNWGEDLIFFRDHQGRLVSVPARWTDKGTMSEAELHILRARLQGGIQRNCPWLAAWSRNVASSSDKGPMNAM